MDLVFGTTDPKTQTDPDPTTMEVLPPTPTQPANPKSSPSNPPISGTTIPLGPILRPRPRSPAQNPPIRKERPYVKRPRNLTRQQIATSQSTLDLIARHLSADPPAPHLTSPHTETHPHYPERTPTHLDKID